MFNNSYRRKVINTSFWQLINGVIDFFQKSFTCNEKKKNMQNVCLQSQNLDSVNK